MALYAFDGTWNKEYTASGELLRNTNVKRFYDLYEGTRNFYVAGVGTRWGIIGRVVGGFFGAGGEQRVTEMYKHLCENYRAGQTHINIIGFSRGAALALDFVNEIAAKGIVDKKGRTIEAKPRVDFLGLFDTVGSFGLNVNVGPLKFQEWDLGHHLTVPDIVDHCYHALALDERRQTFVVRRLDHPRAQEVWFAGVHSDVGGGNGNQALNDVSLRWMACMAARAKLPGFTPERILAATPHWSTTGKVSPPPPYDVIQNKWRRVMPNDSLHYSVTLPRLGYNDPAPTSCRIEHPTEEAAFGGAGV
jgi:uncharacterized protein (DUF2235 family)